MKKKFYILILPILVCFACQDVISVDLDEGDPKLVIEATALQYEDTEEAQITVKLSKTVPFYSTDFTPVSNAEVKVSINNETINLIETPEGSGEYREIIPMVNEQDYELTVLSENEEYRGTTQLQKTVPFDFIEQEKGTSFDPDLISIEAYFSDPVEEENFYYFEFYSQRNGRVLDNTNDELFNGNQVSTYYADEFEAGDNLSISIQGISKRFNNYISILLEQSSNGGGNPFSTPPAAIRGNIQNITKPDNFPLGYFRISQTYTIDYEIQPE